MASMTDDLTGTDPDDDEDLFTDRVGTTRSVTNMNDTDYLGWFLTCTKIRHQIRHQTLVPAHFKKTVLNGTKFPVFLGYFACPAHTFKYF
jgi:hypothetical protein